MWKITYIIGYLEVDTMKFMKFSEFNVINGKA